MRCCLLVLLATPLVGADRLDLVREAVRASSRSAPSSSWSAPSPRAPRASCSGSASSFCLDLSSPESCERRGCGTAEPIRLGDPPELRGASDDAAIDGYLAVEGGWHDEVGRLGARLGFVTPDGGMEGGVDRFYERDEPGSSRWDRLDLWRVEGQLAVIASRTSALRLGAVALV